MPIIEVIDSAPVRDAHQRAGAIVPRPGRLVTTLDLAVQALLAEHPTLGDDFARTRDDGPVLTLAHAICRHAAALEQAAPLQASRA
jgi:hypothetical protein